MDGIISALFGAAAALALLLATDNVRAYYGSGERERGPYAARAMVAAWLTGALIVGALYWLGRALLVLAKG